LLQQQLADIQLTDNVDRVRLPTVIFPGNDGVKPAETSRTINALLQRVIPASHAHAYRPMGLNNPDNVYCHLLAAFQAVVSLVANSTAAYTGSDAFPDLHTLVKLYSKGLLSEDEWDADILERLIILRENSLVPSDYFTVQQCAVETLEL